MISSLKLIFVFALLVGIAHSALYIQEQGNFTANQITLIQNIIHSAEDKHISDFNSLSTFISDYMAKSLKKCWNVYVYDHFTANGNFSARLNSNKWVRWMKYGTLNYTYFMTFDTSIYNSSSIGAQNPITGQSFGKDVQQSDRSFILNLVNETIITKGSDLYANAQYIKTKLPSSGNWNVYITSETKQFGGSECRKGESWVRLQNYGRFKWNYYMSRTY